MNYCTFCGNKVSKDSKFCPKCGKQIGKIEKPQKIKKEEVKEVKSDFKKEEKKERLLLSIGTVLVILASIIFAVTNWHELTSILRILFLVIESLLFLSLSIFSKKVNFKMPYKFLWFIGISFIPLMLHIIGTDKVLGDYLCYDGNGVYVFLAISFFIVSLVYFISYLIIKSNIFLYITYLFSYLFFINIPCLFKLDKFEYMLPIINGFNLIICILHIFIKNENCNKTINRFISVVLLVTSIASIVYSYYEYNIILVIVSFICFAVSILLLIFKSNRNILIYLFPFVLYLVTTFVNLQTFFSYKNIASLAVILLIILFNFIINLKDNKILKNLSFIYSLFFNTLILTFSGLSNITIACVSLLFISLFIFISIIKDEKVQEYISKTMLPIFILVFIYNLINSFMYLETTFIYLISSVILFSTAIIFNYKVKDKYIRYIFEIFAIIYIIISSFLILIGEGNLIAFILNEVAWIYYFIYNRVVKKNKVIYILLLVGLLFNFFMLSLEFSISVYYSLLFIGFITAILDLIELKLKNKTIYVFFSIVPTALLVIFNPEVAIIGFGLCILLYVCNYILLNKMHNVHFVIKYLYTLVGFILISNIFNYFLNNIVLINLFTFLAYLIIIICMFLLRVDSDRKVLSYCFLLIFPYVEVVTNFELVSNASTSLIVLMIVSLILIYFEKVFDLKEREKSIIELTLIVLIHVFTISDMLIFNFIFSTFYIFYGFYKKRDSFILFGTLLLVINLVFNIFKIANNMTATYVVLVIGVIMLAYVFYMEAKKKNKK